MLVKTGCNSLSVQEYQVFQEVQEVQANQANRVDQTRPKITVMHCKRTKTYINHTKVVSYDKPSTMLAII